MYPKIADFKDFIFKAKEIKKEYGGLFDERFCLKYVEGWRDYIYSRTNISMGNRYLMWEYLNDDVPIEVLLDTFIRQKEKEKRLNLTKNKKSDNIKV